LDERGDIDRTDEEPASLMGERFGRVGDCAPRAADEKDVNVIGIRQLAHALDDLERSFGVRVDENDARTLDGYASHQHR
jgi:hypothetical protein